MAKQRSDTERLDWIDQNITSSGWKKTIDVLAGSELGEMREAIDEAIDAAMYAEESSR